jgi:hypothetical protein
MSLWEQRVTGARIYQHHQFALGHQVPQRGEQVHVIVSPHSTIEMQQGDARQAARPARHAPTQQIVRRWRNTARSTERREHCRHSRRVAR